MSKELEKKLEIANSIIKVMVAEYGVYELYVGIHKKNPPLRETLISKKQYNYIIKELKENEN